MVWGGEARDQEEFYEQSAKSLVLQDGDSPGRIGMLFSGGT